MQLPEKTVIAGVCRDQRLSWRTDTRHRRHTAVCLHSDEQRTFVCLQYTRSARSEPRGSVHGADAAAAVLSTYSSTCTRRPRKMFLCSWVNLTVVAQRFTKSVMPPLAGDVYECTVRQWKESQTHRRNTCSGWSWAHGVHVTLASARSPPPPQSVQCCSSRRQTQHGCGDGACRVSASPLGVCKK